MRFHNGSVVAELSEMVGPSFLPFGMWEVPLEWWTDDNTIFVMFDMTRFPTA